MNNIDIPPIHDTEMKQGIVRWLRIVKGFERLLIGILGVAISFLIISIALLVVVKKGTATYTITIIDITILSLFVLVDGILIVSCRRFVE